MRIYIFSGEGSSFAIISQLRIPLTVFFLLSLFSLPIDYTRLRMWEIRIRKFGRVFLFRTSPLPVLSKLSRCAITAVANLIKGHPLIHVTRVSVGTMFLSPPLLSYIARRRRKSFFLFWNCIVIHLLEKWWIFLLEKSQLPFHLHDISNNVFLNESQLKKYREACLHFPTRVILFNVSSACQQTRRRRG